MIIPTITNNTAMKCFEITKDISKHSRAMFDNSLRSIKYSFKVLYEDIKLQESIPNKQQLEKQGIVNFGKTKEEGITLAGYDYNRLIQIPNDETIKLSLINKQTGKTDKIFDFKNGTIKEITTSEKTEEPEEFLEDIIDECEYKLMKFKSSSFSPSPKPYIPEKKDYEKLDEINKVLGTENLIETINSKTTTVRTEQKPRPKKKSMTPVSLRKLDKPIENFGTISEKDTDIVEDIVQKVGKIKEQYQDFHSEHARTDVRLDFPNYVSSESNNRVITFDNIGPMGEKLSISVFHNRGKKYAGIQTKDLKNNDVAYIISRENGTVQRNSPWEFVYVDGIKKRRVNVPDYYTQEEINNSLLSRYLGCADIELEKFSNHIQKRLDRQANFRLTHSNTNVGSMSHYSDTIKNLHKNIDEFKTLLKEKYPSIKEKDSYASQNNINTRVKGLKFYGITPDGKDLRLTFPVVQGKQATNLLVMQNNEIKESYFIMEDKLVRFNVKNENDFLPHSDRQIYYYPKEYVDKIDISKYFELINEKLKVLKENL